MFYFAVGNMGGEFLVHITTHPFSQSFNLNIQLLFRSFCKWRIQTKPIYSILPKLIKMLPTSNRKHRYVRYWY